ncbi:MAG: hypothetical protein WAN03_10525 [Candidatus Sulfotelmatobacter sp.]
MSRSCEIRKAILLPLLLALLTVFGMTARMLAQDGAQDDPNNIPLGDVARNMRKNSPHPQPVIDDDNLSNAMQQAESRHTPPSGLRYVMGGGDKDFRVAAPDVTCSLAFSPNAKSLLSSQYAQMELPPDALAKIHGPATIEGDALTVSIFNGTDWHVSEIAVAVTIVKKNVDASSLNGLSAMAGPDSTVRPEKKPDVTFIYRMRAAAAPWATTTFNAPLNGDLAEGEEWHWAILQARGYPPQVDSGTTPQTTAQTQNSASAQTALPSTTEAAPLSPAVASPSSPQ